MHREPRRGDRIDAIRASLAAPGCCGMLLTGEAGIGKTFLAGAVVDAYEQQGHPTERLWALGVDDVPLGALSRVLPYDAAYSGVTPTVTMKRHLEALDRATIFLVDDADQLDASSVAALVDAALAGLAILIITLRTGAVVPPPIERALTSGAIDRYRCAPLDASATSALAEAFAGAPIDTETSRRITELSQGNPLFVRELVLAAQDAGALHDSPSGLSIEQLPASDQRLVDLLEQRLRSLDPHVAAALHRIAIVGDVGRDEITQFVSEESLESLERSGLIRGLLDGRRLRFEPTHPLHVEIVRSIESPLRSRQIKTEHADHLRSLGMRRDRDKLRLATWALDGICDVGADVLARGAQMAEAGGDLVLAQRLAQLSFDAQPTAESAQLLGARQLATGDFEAMKDHFPHWEALAVTSVQRATYEEMFTQAWFWRGYDERMIQRLADGLTSWQDPVSRSQAQSALAALLVSSGRIDEAVEVAEDLGELPPGATAVLTLMTLGHGWRAQGKPLAAASSVATALDFYRVISPDAYLLSSVAMAGLHVQTLADAGRFVELDQIVAESTTSWRDMGDTSNLALANLARAHSWVLRGDFDQAIALANESIAGFERNRHPGMRRWGLMLHALACAEAGRVADAQRTLDQLETERDHPAHIFAATLARAKAWVAHHRGLSDAASDHLIGGSRRALAVGNRAGALECLHDLARQGRAVEAADRLSHMEVDAFEGVLHPARVAHIRAAATCDASELGRCVAEFDRMGAEHLAAECALAAARHATSARETRDWLRKSSRRPGTVVDTLSRLLAEHDATPRERDVAMLAIQGLTSRQIAEQLGNSTRTVETHLGNIYAKLGVDGRLGLVELLS